jgi:hypothetical protein
MDLHSSLSSLSSASLEFTPAPSSVPHVAQLNPICQRDEQKPDNKASQSNPRERAADQGGKKRGDLGKQRLVGLQFSNRTDERRHQRPNAAIQQNEQVPQPTWFHDDGKPMFVVITAIWVSHPHHQGLDTREKVIERPRPSMFRASIEIVAVHGVVPPIREVVE